MTRAASGRRQCVSRGDPRADSAGATSPTSFSISSIGAREGTAAVGSCSISVAFCNIDLCSAR